jgi:bifunctional non-homologous end joining protein LigD
MPLADYRRKRRFTETPEPVGRARQHSRRRIFVVQKHDASHLHYDFRLAIHGVLVSWAVPKGPSMNPAEKHLAIRTEDHPLEYAEFEGVIPKGQYGAGTVMVWDTGTYDPMDDNIPLEQQLARGKIDFELHGVKLRGGFTLARTGKSSIDANGRERWLLIKQRDEYADPSWDIENPRFDARYLETMRLLGLPITPYIGESTVRDVIASQKGFMCLIRRIFFLSLFMISKPRSCQPRTMPPG